MPLNMRVYAPNGKMISGDDLTPDQNRLITITELSTGRVANVFNQNQVLLSVPNGKSPYLITALFWLSDSSGMLVNIVPSDSYWSDNMVWKVGINGENRIIASNISLIANSSNGRYWIVRHRNNYYLISK